MLRSIPPALLILASPAAAQTALSVAPHIGAGMVIQHGAPALLRGTAPPGDTVTIDYAGQRVSAQTDADGTWRAILPPLPPSQSGTLEVRTASGATLALDDVVTGDVWLCSGQSNMDLPVSGAANPERTMREGAGQPIRILKVRKAASAAPARDVAVDIAWTRAQPDRLGDFSAACWHMARTIVAGGVKVPIGLIQASWGGSTIEDWMPPQALQASGTPAPALATLSAYAADPAVARRQVLEATDRWAEAADPGSAPAAPWSALDVDDARWSRMAVPGQWERSGIAGLGGYDGVMWFRTTVTLTPEQAAAGATLNLGRIDERDRAWMNGIAVGATLTAAENRAYAVPPGTLRAGTNVIAVRVIDEMGGGGFSSPASALTLAPAKGPVVPLAGEWRYRPGSTDSAWRAAPPFVAWSMPRGLAMAWNGMVAPLAGTRLRGIAWYQGESNTQRADAYAGQLAAWAGSWRSAFGNPSLPVVVVQLPGYGPLASTPVDAPWARLREAQRLAVAADRNAGLAVAIDLGVPRDIHPAHKDVVGERMGWEALRVAYGQRKPVAPQPLGARRVGDAVEVALPAGTGTLAVMGAAAPAAFELCQAGKCRFVPATVASDRIVLATGGQPADEVRYAWQGSPPVNVYAASGLPLTPFRLTITR